MRAPSSEGVELAAHLDEAEKKAWQSLARYKFQMFGYWAAIWVHLNRIGQFKRANPWRWFTARGVSSRRRARGGPHGSGP